MFLQTLSLLNFRSYPSLSVSFPPGGALFEGLNGTGKTNVLEAIHVLCTGRSQRGAARGDMIMHGQDSAFIEGEFCGSAAAIGFSRDKKVVMKRDGVDIRSYSEWFGERPVVSFGTNDLDLVYGPPETRRRFLDMLICQIDRAYLAALAAYRKSMACRNALLGKSSDSALFDIYEQAMAENASILVFKRSEAIEELQKYLSGYYAEISGEGENAMLEYAPKIKQKISNLNTIYEWQNVYLNTLSESRSRDAELMFTSRGPHRDDLRFLMNGRLAKSYASQGQCRSFALSLKLGSVLLMERRREGGMIFLVDDAVSELDPERTSRVYPLLEGRGQIFIATPRCHVKLGDGVMKCVVEPGKVTSL
ncbi:MAG: DNA replication and repair protein RecF [Chitinispirillales bacterium]|jgi:DNA replication and repair protein RecF|nr:DNA replication and repair protein RecF [Chitinispirillales bacterium]